MKKQGFQNFLKIQSVFLKNKWVGLNCINAGSFNGGQLRGIVERSKKNRFTQEKTSIATVTFSSTFFTEYLSKITWFRI